MLPELENQDQQLSASADLGATASAAPAMAAAAAAVATDPGSGAVENPSDHHPDFGQAAHSETEHSEPRSAELEPSVQTEIHPELPVESSSATAVADSVAPAPSEHTESSDA